MMLEHPSQNPDRPETASATATFGGFIRQVLSLEMSDNLKLI